VKEHNTMTTILAFVAKYRKFIVALVGAAVLIAGAALGEQSEEYQAIVTVLTSLGVYAVPNTDV
jgi:hypothetical protein